MINNETIIIDISGYQRYYNLDFNRWADNGIDGVILKFGQGAVTEEMWNKLSKSYMPLKAGYCWEYPLWDRPTQLAFYVNEIQTYKPDFYGVDCENWWMSYTEYEQAIKKIIPWSAVRVVPKAFLNDSDKYLVDGLKRELPDLWGCKYTGEWYVLQYCPGMTTWINDSPNWLANHPDSWKGIRRVNWNELLPPAGYSPIYQKTDPGYQRFPVDGFAIWQHSSTMIIPAENYNLDINIAKMTLTEFKVMIGMEPPPPVPQRWDWAITEWAREQPIPYTGPDPA